MKLTVKKNEVIFDYSEIAMSTQVISPDFIKAKQAREFLRKTRCEWEGTEHPQIKRMKYAPMTWATEYGNARELKRLLSSCECQAMWLNYIEISAEFEALVCATEKRCEELYQIEIEKEQARKRETEWADKCKYGCGRCKNLCYDIDLPICKCTGKPLEVKNTPVYKGGVLHLFNLEPFPSTECPFAV